MNLFLHILLQFTQHKVSNNYFTSSKHLTFEYFTKVIQLPQNSTIFLSPTSKQTGKDCSPNKFYHNLKHFSITYRSNLSIEQLLVKVVVKRLNIDSSFWLLFSHAFLYGPYLQRTFFCTIAFANQNAEKLKFIDFYFYLYSCFMPTRLKLNK